MGMFVFIIVLIIVASVLLVLAVLAQSPKSGMAANFGASNQVMGVRQTTDFLERFTWGSAIVIVVLCVAAVMFIPKENINDSKTKLENSILRQSTQTPGFTQPISTEVEATTETNSEPAKEESAE